MPHTILSIRQSLSPGPSKTRQFADVDECLKDVCRMFELYLRHQQNNAPVVTYQIEQLFEFIDKVPQHFGLHIQQKNTDMLFFVPK